MQTKHYKEIYFTLSVIAQIIFITTLLFIKSLPKEMSFWMFSVSIFVMLILYSFKPMGDKRNKKFEDRVKSDLGISHVKTIKKRFPRIFSWIGGFVMPLFPFFSVINKRWKKPSKEAIIHENVHLHYLNRGGFFIYITVSLIFFSFVDTIFKGMSDNRIFKDIIEII